jgi:drug/metabolite transporter (DMT)-like permease
MKNTFFAAAKIQKMNKKGITYLFLLFAMICWGMSFVWYKQALLFFKPVSLVFVRLLVSFPLLIISGILLKRLKKIRLKDLPLFMLLAFFEPFLYFSGESLGMQIVSPTVASILIATVPLFSSIFAYFFIREKLTLKNYIGMIISFLGVLAVIFSDSSALIATWKGVLLILVSVVSAVVYSFLIRKIPDFYNPVTIVAVQNGIAALYFLPFFFLFDFKEMASFHWEFSMVIPAIYLAVFASTFAYLGFIQGLRKIGVSKANVFTNFIPVVTATAAFFILEEAMGRVKACGIILVVAGLVLSQSMSGKADKNRKKVVDELY